jgi:hypothetical protein
MEKFSVAATILGVAVVLCGAAYLFLLHIKNKNARQKRITPKTHD